VPLFSGLGRNAKVVAGKKKSKCITMKQLQTTSQKKTIYLLTHLLFTAFFSEN